MSNRQLTTTNGPRGVMSINIANLDYGRAKSSADKYLTSIGGSTGGGDKQGFPGEQIYFKKGTWYIGIQDKKRIVKDGTRLTMNIPNMMASWAKWADVEGKKNKKGEQLRLPKHIDMTFPFAGDDPSERSSLGDHDKALWEVGDDGKPTDPWKPVLIFPCRSAKDDETINHLYLDTISKVIPGFNLFRDVIDEMTLHEGELPIVELGTTQTSMDKTSEKTVRGKVVVTTRKVTWDIPTFKVVGWADAISADNPAEGGVPVTADEPADLGKVEVKSRTSGKKALPAPPKSKVSAKPTKPVSRRKVEVAEDDTL